MIGSLAVLFSYIINILLNKNGSRGYVLESVRNNGLAYYSIAPSNIDAFKQLNGYPIMINLLILKSHGKSQYNFPNYVASPVLDLSYSIVNAPQSYKCLIAKPIFSN